MIFLSYKTVEYYNNDYDSNKNIQTTKYISKALE